MKVLKICMITCIVGLLASCQSKCPPVGASSDASATTNTATVPDGTSTMANTTVDTTGTSTATPMESKETVGATKSHSSSPHYHNGKRDTMARGNGPDLKAEKKREGNFTNGTGSDNPGR